jgi:hypothetical protein
LSGTTRSPTWKFVTPGPVSTTISGELVAEGDGRLEHHGVIAAAVDLEVGAAGEGSADAKHQLALGGARDGHGLAPFAPPVLG